MSPTRARTARAAATTPPEAPPPDTTAPAATSPPDAAALAAPDASPDATTPPEASPPEASPPDAAAPTRPGSRAVAATSPRAKARTPRRAARFRIAVLGDIHGNVAALDAALTAIENTKPDAIAVLGDLVMNGPRPAEVIARVRTLEAGGAYVVQGNTDIAVADLDHGAAFPWLDVVPAHQVAAAEWAHDQLSEADLDFLRRLPAERRIRVGDRLVLACHASPGSQTDGLPVELDPSVTIQRITRTDARVILCGHTHVAEWREFGQRLVCNPGSCGYAFDGDPGAAWALVTFELPEPEADAAAEGAAEAAAGADRAATTDADRAATTEADRAATTDADATADEDVEDTPTRPAEPAITVELRRADYDPLPMAEQVSARGLPGDVYRAATIRTGRYVR